MNFNEVKAGLKGLSLRETDGAPCWCEGIVGFKHDGKAMHNSSCIVLRSVYAHLDPTRAVSDEVLQREVTEAVKLVACRYSGGLPCFCAAAKAPCQPHESKCNAMRAFLVQWMPPAAKPEPVVEQASELPTDVISIDKLPAV